MTIESFPQRVTTAFDDEWGLSSPGYSRDKVYTRASDEHGHSIQTRVNNQPVLIARCEKLMRNGLMPWWPAGVADCYRDGFVHNLKFRNDTLINDAILDQLLLAEMEECELEHLEMVDSSHHRLVAHIRSISDKLIATGRIEQLLERMEAWRELIPAMTPPHDTELTTIVLSCRERLALRR